MASTKSRQQLLEMVEGLNAADLTYITMRDWERWAQGAFGWHEQLSISGYEYVVVGIYERFDPETGIMSLEVYLGRGVEGCANDIKMPRGRVKMRLAGPLVFETLLKSIDNTGLGADIPNAIPGRYRLHFELVD